jgi:hypothetical protein
LLHGPSGWNLLLWENHYDIEQLAGTCEAISIEPSGYLNFGSGSTPFTAPWTSRTIAFIFMPKNDYDHPSVSGGFNIFNMKLWIENDSAFNGLPGQPYIQMLPSGVWVRNLNLGSGQYGAYEVPRSVPENPNVFRADGQAWMSGVGQQQRTQIIYASIVFPSGEYPVGQYGGLGLGTFRWRFTYDWTDQYARLQLPEDY